MCKHTLDYPRCRIRQRASKFAKSKGRMSATCPPPPPPPAEKQMQTFQGKECRKPPRLDWLLTHLQRSSGPAAALRHRCFHFFPHPRSRVKPPWYNPYRLCSTKGEISVIDMAPMGKHPKTVSGYHLGKRKYQWGWTTSLAKPFPCGQHRTFLWRDRSEEKCLHRQATPFCS